MSDSITGKTVEARQLSGGEPSPISFQEFGASSQPAQEANPAATKKQVVRDRFSGVLAALAISTLVVAGILTLVIAVTAVRWLLWIQIGVTGLGLALALVTWVVYRREARSIARVTRRLDRTLSVQSRHMQAFRDIAAAVGQSLDLREVLELGLERVLQVTGRKAAEIHLLDPDERTMAVTASFGEPEGFLMREEVLMLGECLCGLAVLNDELLLVPDTESDPRVTRLSCQRYGFQSAACIPLRVKGRAIGVLTVHGKERQEFSAEDTELLVAVANQLATAIENARLYTEMEARVEALSQELQHMAVVEERERLSREMHDGVAQTLSLLSIQVGQVKSLLSGGDTLEALEELQQITRVIDAGYEDVREAITSLRLTAPKGKKFVGWLQEYVYEFGLRHDLSTDVQVSGEAESLVLPPLQEVHLTRIIQEALNNIRKHSQADRVEMALRPNGRRLKLRIEDNGLGFDVDQARRRRGRYGLSTMQERAEILGGSLHIESAPGKGTVVAVEIEREGMATDERK